MAINATRDVVPAVFTSHDQADAAIDELRQLGFDDDDQSGPVADPVHHRLMDKSVLETLKGLTRGAAIGAPLGALLGIGLLLITLPSLMATGIVGVAVAVYLGGAFGAYLGSVVGLGAAIERIPQTERRYSMSLTDEDTLVVVLAGRQTEVVRQILDRHGAHGIAPAMA
jgi:hypothetical protein